MQPPTPGGAPPTLPSAPVGTLLPEAAEQAPIRIQNVLQSALQSGALDTVVNTLLAKEEEASRDVQVARELREGFEKAVQDGHLEEKCSDMLCPPSNDSMQEQTKNRMRDALASDKFESALGNLQAADVRGACGLKHKPPSAVEQASQPESRPQRPPGPSNPRPAVRRSHTQDIASVREQLKDLKTENARLREKVDQMEKLMQEEEKRRREATLLPPAA